MNAHIGRTLRRIKNDDLRIEFTQAYFEKNYANADLTDVQKADALALLATSLPTFNDFLKRYQKNTPTILHHTLTLWKDYIDTSFIKNCTLGVEFGASGVNVILIQGNKAIALPYFKQHPHHNDRFVYVGPKDQAFDGDATLEFITSLKRAILKERKKA